MKSFISFLDEQIDNFKDFEKMRPVSVEKIKHRLHYQYVVDYGTGEIFTFTPYFTSTYKKTGLGNRLRDPSKTTMEVWVEISRKKNGTYRGTIKKTFAKAIGEYSLNDTKLSKGREKAQTWFKKYLGVDLGKHDFYTS